MRKFVIGFCAPSLLSVMLLSLSVMLLSACSSVPDFRPTHAIEEAQTWQEALLSCAEYKIPGEDPLQRTAVLVPWVRCDENIFRIFENARFDEPFVLFHRELARKAERYNESKGKVIDVKEWNARMPEVLAFLANQDSSATIESSPAWGFLANNFPDFALYLRPNVKKSAPRPKVRALLLFRAPGLTEQLLEKNLEYWKSVGGEPACLKFMRMQADLLRLEELEEYRGTIAGRKDASSAELLRTVDSRVDELVKRLKPETQHFEMMDCVR